MATASLVICDSGILPGYITLLIYLVVLLLVHFFVIVPFEIKKEKLAKRIVKKFNFLKKKEKIVIGIIQVIVLIIVFAVMFFVYPAVTSHNCPHLFWRLFGIETL